MARLCTHRSLGSGRHHTTRWGGGLAMEHSRSGGSTRWTCDHHFHWRRTTRPGACDSPRRKRSKMATPRPEHAISDTHTHTDRHRHRHTHTHTDRHTHTQTDTHTHTHTLCTAMSEPSGHVAVGKLPILDGAGQLHLATVLGAADFRAIGDDLVLLARDRRDTSTGPSLLLWCDKQHSSRQPCWDRLPSRTALPGSSLQLDLASGENQGHNHRRFPAGVRKSRVQAKQCWAIQRGS